MSKKHYGRYDEEGRWQSFKHCFIYCGDERCDCGPPNGQFYDPAYDKRIAAQSAASQTSEEK